MKALGTPKKDLVDVMGSSVAAMQAVAAEKMKIFGSSGKAQWNGNVIPFHCVPYLYVESM
jgi:hypothetical protein